MLTANRDQPCGVSRVPSTAGIGVPDRIHGAVPQMLLLWSDRRTRSLRALLHDLPKSKKVVEPDCGYTFSRSVKDRSVVPMGIPFLFKE